MSAVEALHGVQIDEHDIVGKCTNVVGYLEKAAQEVDRDLSSGIITIHLLLRISTFVCSYNSIRLLTHPFVLEPESLNSFFKHT